VTTTWTAPSEDDLQRVCARRQDLTQERVGIEGDRGKQVSELGRAEADGRGLLGGRSRNRPSGGSMGRNGVRSHRAGGRSCRRRLSRIGLRRIGLGLSQIGLGEGYARDESKPYPPALCVSSHFTRHV
jgi:hypothetical protein